jgi:hypothetical protein
MLHYIYFVGSKWTAAAEKLLLTRHKEMEESNTLHKNKWKKNSEEKNHYKYNFTPEQCRLKIKSLKEKYDRNKKKNNKSGEAPASDSDQDELKEIFDKMPDMKPVCVIDSTKRKSFMTSFW